MSAALAHATEELKSLSDSAELDAQLLLAHVLGKKRAWLYTWPDHQLTTQEQAQFSEFCRRRAQGEPIAYLLGKREFWKFELQVSPAVLIPRPETELLVELALQLVTAERAKVADLGTGSGAIALALAYERPHWQVFATDMYQQALTIAGLNARQLQLANLTFLAGSWCKPLPDGDYSLIVSNPPYIDADDPHMQQGDLRFEPRTALVAAKHGLGDLQQIAQQAREKLAPDGYLLLEHGWQQGAVVRNILNELGYTRIQTIQDHGNRDRVTLGCKAETSL